MTERGRWVYDVFNRLGVSMSRRGICHDNAVAESFFSSMELEQIKKKIYASRDKARLDLVQYIECYSTINIDTATTVACRQNSSKTIILGS